MKKTRYKIEVDANSPSVCVLKDVPTYKVWGFLQAHPEYNKYAAGGYTPIPTFKKCRAGSTALWKLIDALTYWYTDKPTNIKRDLKDLKKNYGVNVSSEMRWYLESVPTLIDGKTRKMYKLNFSGEWLRDSLKREKYPMEELCKADRKQERKYLQAIEDAKKVVVDYYNWDIESSLETLK